MRVQASRETLASAVGAGVIAGFLFSLLANGQSGGVLLLLMPGFPLLLAGLGLGALPSIWAALIAFFIANIGKGLPEGIFFAAFIAGPAYYFIRRALLWRDSSEGVRWYPVLRILSELTVVVASCLMFLAWITQKSGGLQALIPHGFGDGFKNTDPEFASMAQNMLNQWSFLLFALMGWLWVVLFYGAAVLANRLLAFQSVNLRPSLALEPGGVPAGILLLLMLGAALSLVGTGLDRYTAQTLFILLLLPYLLSGLASVHRFAVRRQITFRKIWLGCFYVALVCTLWPLLGIIAIGLYTQLSEILDRSRKKR